MSDLINGIWINNLNSKVEITTTSIDAYTGYIKGAYRTAVSSGNEEITSNTLSGNYRLLNNGEFLISLSVQWSIVIDNVDKYSVSSWSGKYYVEDKTIHTTWILKSNVAINKEWESVTTNMDMFTKKQ